MTTLPDRDRRRMTVFRTGRVKMGAITLSILRWMKLNPRSREGFDIETAKSTNFDPGRFPMENLLPHSYTFEE